MPFEPLRTDEKVAEKVKGPADMDSVMLFGCTSFVFVSVLSYALGVWPMFVIPETHRLANLGMALGVGLLPATILGIVATRKTGLPGACGFVGGAMAIGIFLFLRLEQLMLGYYRNDLPQPEYPKSWMWLVPVAWLVAALIVAIIFMPKGEFGDEKESSSSR